MTKRFFSFTLLALFAAGFSLPVHAESANYYIRQQEATDPGYQSALHGTSDYGNYSSYSNYSDYSNASDSSHSYVSKRSYDYSSSRKRSNSSHKDTYQSRSYKDGNGKIVDSFWNGSCKYIVYSANGGEYITRTCDK